MFDTARDRGGRLDRDPASYGKGLREEDWARHNALRIVASTPLGDKNISQDDPSAFS